MKKVLNFLAMLLTAFVMTLLIIGKVRGRTYQPPKEEFYTLRPGWNDEEWENAVVPTITDYYVIPEGIRIFGMLAIGGLTVLSVVNGIRKGGEKNAEP